MLFREGAVEGRIRNCDDDTASVGVGRRALCLCLHHAWRASIVIRTLAIGCFRYIRRVAVNGYIACPL